MQKLSFVCCVFLLSLSCVSSEETVTSGGVTKEQQSNVSSTTASSEPTIDCQDRADGLYVRDPNACNDGFYKCSSGRSFYYRCPTGLFFGIEDAQCQYKQLIPACGGQRPVYKTTIKAVPPSSEQEVNPEDLLVSEVAEFVKSNKRLQTFLRKVLKKNQQ